MPDDNNISQDQGDGGDVSADTSQQDQGDGAAPSEESQQQVEEFLPQSQDQSTTSLKQPPVQQMQSVAPVQENQPQQQPVAQQATANSPQEPPATYDQLKWPDSIELTEGQGDVVKSDDQKIIEFSKKASQLADQLKEVANKIKASTDKVNQEMTRINGVLDEFYQRAGFDQGKATVMLK